MARYFYVLLLLFPFVLHAQETWIPRFNSTFSSSAVEMRYDAATDTFLGEEGVGTGNFGIIADHFQTVTTATTTGTVSMNVFSNQVTGTGTSFTTELSPSQVIKIGNDVFRVMAIDSDTVLYTDSVAGTTHTNEPLLKDTTMFRIDDGGQAAKLTIAGNGMMSVGGSNPQATLTIEGSVVGDSVFAEDSQMSLMVKPGTDVLTTGGAAVTDVLFDFSRTINVDGGTIANERPFQILAPTIAGANVNEGSTVYIDGPLKPAAAEDLGTNTALWVDTGRSRFDSGIYAGDIAMLDDPTQPAYAFFTDFDTGIGSAGGNAMNIITGGVRAVQINSSQQSLYPATSTAIIASQADTLSGLSFPFNGEVDIRVNNAPKLQVTGSTTISKNNFYVPDGTALLPSLSFDSDIDTGMFLPSVGVMAMTVGGFEVLRATTNEQLLAKDGSALIPAYSFSSTGANDTGMYHKVDGSSNDVLGFAAGGATFMEGSVGAGTVAFQNVQLQVPTGTLAAPGLSWGSDTDSGLYRTASGTYSYASNGKEMLRFTPDHIAVMPPTANGSGKKIYEGNVVTTGTASTTVITYTTTLNSTALIDTKCSAMQADDAAGAVYERLEAKRNAGGTVTGVGAVSNPIIAEDDTTWNMTSMISGSDVLIQVVGDDVNSVKWECVMEVVEASN